MGLIILLLSAFSFSLSSYFGKIVTNTTDMSGVIVSFSRFLIGAIIMFIYIVVTKKSFKSIDFKPIWNRTLFNSFSIIMFSASLKYTTITNANMLNMIYPVFVIILAPYVLGEIVNKSKYIYLLTVMLGTYIIADPHFGSINKGDLLSFASSLTAAISMLNLTKAREKNEGYLIVFYVMFIGTLINIPFAFKDIINFELSSLFLVFLAGTLGFLGQVFITWGYKYVDASTGALISTSRIVISALIGIILLGEPIDLKIIIGIILIGGSLVGLSGYFDKKNKCGDTSINDNNDLEEII